MLFTLTVHALLRSFLPADVDLCGKHTVLDRRNLRFRFQKLPPVYIYVFF